MLQTMREHARGLFGWLIIGSVIAVLAVFGFGSLTFFTNSEPAVATVGEGRVTQSEYAAELERQRQQLAASFGERFDPALVEQLGIPERVLESLINRELLNAAAADAGLAAPGGELDQIITSMPQFQGDLGFDEDRFRFTLQSIGMTPATFRSAMGADLSVDQLTSGVADSSFITEAELRALATVLLQNRDIAWLRLAPSEFEADVLISDEALQAFFEARRSAYRAPTRVRVEALRLDRFDFEAEQDLSEEAVLAAYEREKAAFEGQEQREAAHILLAETDDRDLDAARALAETLMARLEAGEDFAALAEEFSDDPGSASDGGRLGAAARGTFVGPFEDALFSMTPGELRGPVETEFGVHLLRLDNVFTTALPSFDELAFSLRERLRTEAAEAAFAEAKAKLEVLAYEAPDLTEPAEALGLTLERPEPFSRDGGEGIFATAEVREAAFSAEVREEGYNSAVLEPREGLAVVLRVIEEIPARDQTLDEVRDAVTQAFIAEASAGLAEAAAQAVLDELAAGTSIFEVTQAEGREWVREEGLLRTNTELPPALRDAAFRLAPPTAEELRRLDTVRLPSGEQLVLILTDVRPGNYDALSDEQKTSLRAQLAQRSQGVDFTAFREALARDFPVERSRSNMAELP
jgi:peptidyl-prolyl cis-trans isomerase D